MRPLYIALYLSIGAALGLWLNAVLQTSDSQAEHLAPSPPTASSAYA